VKGSYDRVKAQHGADVMDNEMIITVSAIVASYVTVFKAFNLVDNRFLPLIALGIAAVFVLVPSGIYDKLIQISTIGLGAAGVYQMTKRKQ
jgi:predicted metal-binding membrane protein